MKLLSRAAPQLRKALGRVVRTLRRLRGRAKLVFSAVAVVGLLLELFNDVLGIRSFLFSPDPVVSISNVFDFQGTMYLNRSGVDGSTDHRAIRWHPLLLISNSGSSPVSIVDVDVEFPVAAASGRVITGDTMSTERSELVQLRKTKTENIIVFQDLRDLIEVKRITDEQERTRAEEIRPPLDPVPVVIPPGGEKILEFMQLYTFEVQGRPARLPSSSTDFIGILGPYLQLHRDESGNYFCSQRLLDVTVRTNTEEEISQEVGILLLPIGCKILTSPPSSTPDTPGS